MMRAARDYDDAFGEMVRRSRHRDVFDEAQDEVEDESRATECGWLATCPFFNELMGSLPTTADMAKKRYCRGSYPACARYQVHARLGAKHVPADLFPDQAERARALIENHERQDP